MGQCATLQASLLLFIKFNYSYNKSSNSSILFDLPQGWTALFVIVPSLMKAFSVMYQSGTLSHYLSTTGAEIDS